MVSKTVLDHYLPKSEFPYFAVNIFNLYPCCWRCNSADLKGDNIPIERDATGTYHYLIMHPHHYEDSRLSFNYIPSSPQHPMDDIELSCSDPYIEKGYKNILGIEALYKNYIDEARKTCVCRKKSVILHSKNCRRSRLKLYCKSL